MLCYSCFNNKKVDKSIQVIIERLTSCLIVAYWDRCGNWVKYGKTNINTFFVEEKKKRCHSWIS